MCVCVCENIFCVRAAQESGAAEIYRSCLHLHRKSPPFKAPTTEQNKMQQTEIQHNPFFPFFLFWLKLATATAGAAAAARARASFMRPVFPFISSWRGNEINNGGGLMSDWSCERPSSDDGVDGFLLLNSAGHSQTIYRASKQLHIYTHKHTQTYAGLKISLDPERLNSHLWPF